MASFLNRACIALVEIVRLPSNVRNSEPSVRSAIYVEIASYASLLIGRVRAVLPLPRTLRAPKPLSLGGAISAIWSACASAIRKPSERSVDGSFVCCLGYLQHLEGVQMFFHGPARLSEVAHCECWSSYPLANSTMIPLIWVGVSSSASPILTKSSRSASSKSPSIIAIAKMAFKIISLPWVFRASRMDSR